MFSDLAITIFTLFHAIKSGFTSPIYQELPTGFWTPRLTSERRLVFIDTPYGGSWYRLVVRLFEEPKILLGQLSAIFSRSNTCAFSF